MRMWAKIKYTPLSKAPRLGLLSTQATKEVGQKEASGQVTGSSLTF